MMGGVKALQDTILKVDGLSKHYSGVKALDGVSLEIKRGEVHSICGENGAGKSTFIKMLTGAIEPTGGTIEFEGTIYSKLTPRLSRQLGIAVIYQEFSSIPYLTVSENIFYGLEVKKGMMRDISAMNKKAQELCRGMNVDINIRSRVCDLGIAYQQIVEILKAVSQNAKLIIMDEPTAPLTVNETNLFFKIIKQLKSKNVTIIFISHRLEEVFQICDKVSVFCDGRLMVTKDVKELDRKHLISYMVGRELSEDIPQPQKAPGVPILKVEHLTNKHVKDVSFELREGEILGFGGLVGAGRTELARAIFGADKIQSGEIFLSGQTYVPRSPKHALRAGIGLIPEDRKNQGVLLAFTIEDNIVFSVLKKCSKFAKVLPRICDNYAKKYIDELQIKTPSKRQLVKNLSGGNQQKVVLAKMLATDCKILIFDEPIRGIDVATKHEIYQLICKLADAGKSIIVISSEMPELIGISQRIIVMSNGYVSGELEREDFSQEEILELASSKL